MNLQRLLRPLRWRVLPSLCAVGAILLATGCHRPPATAAELAKVLPPAFIGEWRSPGNNQPLRIRIEPRELSIRNEHVLEFNRVDYQILDLPESPGAEGEARIRGTITVPGLDIRLEMVGADAGGVEDAIRPETFVGKLTGNLRSLEAEWSTGLGQKARLTLQAPPP